MISGTVIGNKGKAQCEVEFDDFDRQVVFSNSLIPTQGSTSRPKIKVPQQTYYNLKFRPRSFDIILLY